MKLVMTLLVRDEQDIIRANIDFHLNQGVDFIIATDNRSVDATKSILMEYESRGKLKYIYEACDNYNQHAWVTRMARMAYTNYNADWVINNDADEFWLPLDGNLRDAFERLPCDTDIVEAQRYNFVATGSPERDFWKRMIYREKISLNSQGKALPPKVAHRGSERIKIVQGNHSVECPGHQKTVKNVIEILHFPIRTLAQIENKISKGGAAYEANTELPKSVGSTWRELYKKFKTDSNLVDYFTDQYYESDRLSKALHQGLLIEDRRLFNVLQKS